MTIYGAIEAGGTKFVCGVGSARQGSLETATIPTRDPDRTFADIAAFFQVAGRHGAIEAIGIALDMLRKAGAGVSAAALTMVDA